MEMNATLNTQLSTLNIEVKRWQIPGLWPSAEN
jgi:hypothetical protein